MYNQPSRATSEIESTKAYGKNTNGRQDSHDIRGQPNNTGLASKRQQPHIPYRRNKKDGDEENKLEDKTPMGQGTRWDQGKRVRRHPCIGCSDKRRHHRRLQESPKECGAEGTRRDKR